MPINREILRLAIPNIISNISVPLLATVDTILMGQLSTAHLGAVGLGSMMFSFFYWNFGFLRMGTTGLTSQAYGAEDSQRITDHLARALLLALGLAAMIVILQQPFYEVGARLLQVIPSQEGIVTDYFDIRIWAAPATLALYVLLGWFFGMQNAIYPMILTIFINVVNIAASYIAVIHLGLEARGAAWGTVIAQYSGVVLAILLLRYRYADYLQAINLAAIREVEALKAFFRVNQDLFIRTVCLTIAFGFFYSKSSEAGAMVLAANVILLQLVNWMSYGIDGFAYASEALVGKYAGAKDDKRLKMVIKYSLYWGGALAIAYSLAYGLLGGPILRLFSTDMAVIALAQGYLLWMIVLPIVGYACYIWDGIYVGLTATRALRNTMLVAMVLYLSTYYLAPLQDQGHLLWLSLLILLASRGVMQMILYAKYGRALD